MFLVFQWQTVVEIAFVGCQADSIRNVKTKYDISINFIRKVTNMWWIATEISLNEVAI